MKRIINLLILLIIPYSLLASEVQHVLGGIGLFILCFVAIVLGINILFIFIYRKTRNKLTAVLNFIIGGITAYLGFKIHHDDKMASFIGIPIIFISLITLLYPIKDLYSKGREQNPSDTDKH